MTRTSFQKDMEGSSCRGNGAQKGIHSGHDAYGQYYAGMIQWVDITRNPLGRLPDELAKE